MAKSCGPCSGGPHTSALTVLWDIICVRGQGCDMACVAILLRRNQFIRRTYGARSPLGQRFIAIARTTHCAIVPIASEALGTEWVVPSDILPLESPKGDFQWNRSPQ